MPPELKLQLEKISSIRGKCDELIDVLEEHEFIGAGELREELVTDATKGSQAVDIGHELERLIKLQRRLVRRLEEVDAVLGANPC
eukprot:CAMPEP_0185767868 /NCGR_PEP_ID=MMETSP1174-20130828/45612_1 /TAXON_ID=35687 /ORGANISM="Dictyocha speculum, Strain CCMP1381" /LENGTH=84 /DNA_ID=CAMNT_0028452239 /DNA_START=54 /DNA_END=308 /DNA_ORIENTATION=+